MRRAGLHAAGIALLIAAASGTAVAAPAGEAGQRDLARVLAAAPEQPWLRINARGHTGAVQALAFTPDSNRLCSAGLDKTVEVWNLTGTRRDLRRTFLLERTIRWQVARGLRGSIYAVAVAPSDGLLAIGGYGAMGSLGEILLVDPVQGSLTKVLDSHRQTVCSLAFSPDGNRLVSVDAAGQVVLWNRGDWKPRILYGPDSKTYDALTAQAIQRQPKLRPAVFLGNGRVVVPVWMGEEADGRLRWQLNRIDAADPERFDTLDVVHHGMASALAATPDGKRLASADLEGKLHVWDLSGGGAHRELDAAAPVVSLALARDGGTLVAGTLVDRKEGKSRLQVWDLKRYAVAAQRRLPDHVHACAISPDGKQLAYCGGSRNQVFVESLAEAAKKDRRVIELRGVGRRLLKVAFAAEEPYYRVAFGWDPQVRAFNDYADLQETFDTNKLELGSGAPPKPADWITADWWQGPWQARAGQDGVLQLFRNNVPQGFVRLDPVLEGKVRSYCWVPDPEGKPFALAVGTDLQDSIYVLRLAERGPCPILRHFRGHHDYVASVGVSRDLRFLISGSADGTVRFWSLDGYQHGGELSGRWGAEFTVLKPGDQEQLVARHVRPGGPLGGKGLHDGDVLSRIRWWDGRSEQAEQRPDAILKRLAKLPWWTQVVFETTRNGRAREPFQLLPAWRPLATLFVASNRQWAFWTPEGYYDASAEGHTLFGWQINRGLAVLPDFYRADQFRKRLERPDVMERLLPAGNLEDAFRQAALKPPAEPEKLLPDQIAAVPRVEILSPRPGEVIPRGDTKVTARIRIPTPGKMVQAKVFANGVVALRQEPVRTRDLPEATELTCTWDVALPADAENLIQLVVGTDQQVAAFQNVLVQRPAQPPAARPPRLYLLALGINQYADKDVPRLTFSVADATEAAEVIRARSKGLYELASSTVLVDAEVTPDAWRRALDALRKKIRAHVAPDDLLVIFLAGHGILDEQTGQYYYLGHEFKMEDLETRDFSRCLSWKDFQLLADVPCRKLALLDTCHSGAIQPLRSRSLKAAIRTLQDDVIFTVTASAGNERAAEKKQWGHGVFTKCLLEALKGSADASRDGVVGLNEVVSYVRQSVPRLTADRQNPTASPSELLSFTRLPLATTK